MLLGRKRQCRCGRYRWKSAATQRRLPRTTAQATNALRTLHHSQTRPGDGMAALVIATCFALAAVVVVDDDDDDDDDS